MKLISKEAGSALTVDQTAEFKHVFKDINISKMKYLGEGFVTVESYSDDLCLTYDCMVLTEYSVEVNGTKSDDLSISINSGESTIEDICGETENIQCYEYEATVATYNCLGWALGISKWVGPSDIDESIKDGLNKEQAVIKFIEDNNNKYPSNSPSNFENIISKLKILDSVPEVLVNNTVIFYFKDNECTHAARYITQLDKIMLNQWVSKAGPEELVSHDESELLSPQIYGSSFVYVGVVDDLSEAEL